MITDTRGKLIYINNAWSRVYGYSFEEAKGETPRLLRSPHQTDEFYAKMWKQILDPNFGTWRGELINCAKDGTEVPVLLNITPYKSELGTTLGYMGLALDLRKQRSLEAQVAQQDRLATIGELTSGLAHEIGTPIGVIRGRAEMLQMQTPEDSPMQKSLDIIIKQADRISNLISSLLRLSRKTEKEALQNVAIRPLVDEVEDLLIQRLRKHNIQFINSVNETTLALADRNRLEQILINLMVNSIQAIESIKEKNPQHPRRLEIKSEVGTHSVKISVMDTGGGIPEKIRDKIFNPFFTTKPTSKGTGLGLAIVQRILDEIGATIALKTEEGVGSEFILFLKPPRPQ